MPITSLILDGSNAQVLWTGLPGSTIGTASPGFWPYGTVGNAVDGELGIKVVIAGSSGAGSANVSAEGRVAHDAVATTIAPLLAGGYSSAAAPTGVSGDGDSVRAWFLRNGAQATVLTAAGALIGGDATNGLDVDITRVASVGYSASATFTPAAASHTAGDVNGAAGTFATMGPSAGRIMITSVSLEIDGATAEATAWRLYLFNVTPPSALADDAAFTLPSGDRASFLGQIDLGTAVDLVDTQYIEVNGVNKQIKLSGTSVFAYLVNLTTLTPAAVGHIVTLHAVAV